MLNGTPYNISGPQTQNATADIKSFLYTEYTSYHTIKISKDKLLMDSKPVVVPGKYSAHAPKDYPKVSTKWVKDILIVQQTKRL